MRSTAERTRSAVMSMLVVVSSVGASACLASSERTPFEPDAGLEPDAGEPDATVLSCTPRSVYDEDTSTFERWPVGRTGEYLEVGFTVREFERTQAEAILGHACEGTLCTIVTPKTGPLTVEQYELMCRIDAELGPRFWWASNRAS